MSSRQGAIAIVGLGCRFPGDPGVRGFWRTIREGRACFGEVPGDRWRHDVFYSPNPRDLDKTYARKLASVGDLRAFAPEWFGLPPRRAKIMDPQQRLLLESVRHALDDAGYGFGARPMPTSTGVFVGASVSEHKDLVTSRMRGPHLFSGAFGRVPELPAEIPPAVIEDVAPMQAYSMVGQLLNMIACNVTQAFDWRGPAFAADAACSSTLVALHEAVLNLRAGVVDAAVVGGVYTVVTPDNLVAFSRIGAISRSDACRPFDERADGFVLGEGVGVIVLKRWEDAVRDGDRVRALILGVGMNNDGRGEGPMTPRLEGQLDALDRAYRDAGVSPDTVGYVEAHGTATPVGDATEITGLRRYFHANAQGPIACAVASVKGNIGHTLAAAGAAGLIRAALVLEKGEIPPQAGFEKARAALELDGSGFDVPTAARPFVPRAGVPRRAGVSAFGFGGTNVHVLLEEAPAERATRAVVAVPSAAGAVASAPADAAMPEPFLLSAPTPALLATYLDEVRAAVADERPALADLAYTLAVGRRREAAAVAFVARDHAELDRKLAAAAAAARGEGPAEGIFFAAAPAEDAAVAFLFPGQGAQAPGLCEDLYRRFPAFRKRLDALAATLDGALERPLLSYLYGPQADLASLTRTEVCQPVLAALELALVDFVASLGLRPRATIGHSLGEFVAAAAGGVLAPEAALRLVAERGRVMRDLALPDPGAMAAVAADLPAVQALCADVPGVVAANVNHPKQVVVSGTTAGVDALVAKAQGAGLRVTRLTVSHAFHSPLMAGVSEALAKALALLELRAPRATVISCIAPGPYPADPAAIARIFVEHATAPVNFLEGARRLREAGARALLQVGAGSTLVTMARKTWRADGAEPLVATTLADAEPSDGAKFLEALAELAVVGVPLELAPLWEGTGARATSVPSCPLETRPFWVVKRKEPKEALPALAPAGAGASSAPEVTRMSKGSNGGAAASPELVALFQRQMEVLQAQVEIIRRQAQLLGGEAPADLPLAAAAPASGVSVPAAAPAMQAAPAPAPAAAAPSAPPPPAAAAAPSVDVAAVEGRVLDFVAQVSAFPRQNLKKEQRLSGDLAFDSLMAVDLSVHIAETWPEVGQLPRSLFAGDTTIADVVKYVTTALGKRREAAAPAATGGAPELLRYVVAPAPRPVPEPPASADLPFAGPVTILADARGVAAELAARLGQLGREAKVIALDGQPLPEGTQAVVDLRPLDLASAGAALPGAADLRAPVLAAFRAARAMARGAPAAYVAAHAGLAGVGVAGFAKALAREWPEALVKAVEVAADAPAAVVADALVIELRTSDRSPEVSWASGARETLALRPDTLPARPNGAPALRDGVVAVISGGARGLGAKLAVELARRHRARLLLLGRSRADDAVAATIAAVEAAGGKARYAACDVTDAAQVATAVAAARAKLGPIEVVVHAAGVLADGPVQAKDDEAFARVFDTKVAGALALWDAVRGDPVRALLVIGSWAGRFGNAHQTDYAAANHALARLAGALAAARPGLRAVTLDLPPWEGSGMVEALPEAVRRGMRARGVPFLTDATGLPLLVAELGADVTLPSGEVVLASALGAPPAEDVAIVRLSLAEAPWLDDHRVGGVPVLPMAAALDHAAAAARRLGLAGPLALRDVELQGGVRVEGDTRLWVRATRRGDEVEVELASQTGAGPRQAAYRGRVLAAPGGLPPLDPPADGAAPTLALDTFYARHAFHGPRLQAVTSVTSIGPTHVAGVVRVGRPGELGASVLDVLALDGLLQLCAYWATVTHGRVGLPLALDELRLERPLPAGAEVRVTAVLLARDGDAITCAVDVRDAAGAPLAQLRGLRTQLVDRERVVAAAGANGHGAGADVPADAWRIDQFPEVAALRQRIEMARAIGMEIPYFNVHERVTNETSIIGGREFVNFASYNYLGLSGDEEVNAAAAAAIARYGTSVSASRVASGEKPLHRDLEQAIASFLGCEDAIVMVGGHATNVSVVGHLFGPQDLVLHDSLAHDSILGGIRLAGAKRRPFPHNDVDALDKLLGQLRDSARRVLIAVEGVYSMDGDVAPLDKLIELKKKHKALLFVDEAHSLGVLGATGRGVGEHFGVGRADVELWMGTLSKSLASCGGYIAGSRALVEYLKYTNPGFVYSVGISPANAAAALAALRVLEREPERVTLLRERSRLFLDLCRERGIDTGMSDGSAVIPAIVGNSWDCLKLSQALKHRGINVQPILYPAVEEDLARLRFFVTARHTETQLRQTADALAEELAKLNPKYLQRRARLREARHGDPGQPSASTV